MCHSFEIIFPKAILHSLMLMNEIWIKFGTKSRRKWQQNLIMRVRSFTADTSFQIDQFTDVILMPLIKLNINIQQKIARKKWTRKYENGLYLYLYLSNRKGESFYCYCCCFVIDFRQLFRFAVCMKYDGFLALCIYVI